MTLAGIQHPGAGLFDTGLLADRLTLDLLVGWGADRTALTAAAAHVPLDRLEELFVP